jgi:hypothetical protein
MSDDPIRTLTILQQMSVDVIVDAICGCKAARDVLDERARQQDVEGWTPDRDDGYVQFELGKAAAGYVAAAILWDETRESAALRTPPGIWPWHRDWWKPTDRRRDLVKAAALIIAEIERLDRADEAAKP